MKILEHKWRMPLTGSLVDWKLPGKKKYAWRHVIEIFQNEETKRIITEKQNKPVNRKEHSRSVYNFEGCNICVIRTLRIENRT